MVEVKPAPARERLIAAAGELFYAHGIAATGVDAVLRQARVAPATLYAHFPGGKDALVAEYLRQRFAQWQQLWGEMLDRSSDATARALSVFDALVEYRRAGYLRGCTFLSAAVELPAEHPGREWLAADTAFLRQQLRSLADALGVPDPELVSRQLVLLYDGALADGLRESRETSEAIAVVRTARATAARLIEEARRA